MMQDYTYQSVLFAYLLFVIFGGLAVYFFIRSMKDGYWGKDSEEPKYRMMQDEPLDSHLLPAGAHASQRLGGNDGD
jgi:hypothetical protein